MNKMRYNGSIKERDVAAKPTRIVPTRFICIPGTRPVKVPARIPRKIKIIISISIILKKQKNGFLIFILSKEYL